MEAAAHCINHYDALEGLRPCARCGRVFCGDCVVTLRGEPFCAVCKNEQLMDVQSGIDTTKPSYASTGRRFVALFLDSILMRVPAFGLNTLTTFVLRTFFYGAHNNLWVISGLSFFGAAIFWTVYEGLMMQARGQTVGKMALKLKVVRADGSTISRGQAWGRAAARALLSLLVIVDYIPAFFREDKATLHDMMAGTRVINV